MSPHSFPTLPNQGQNRCGLSLDTRTNARKRARARTHARTRYTHNARAHTHTHTLHVEQKKIKSLGAIPLTAMYRVEQKKIKSLGAIPLITKLLSSRTPEVQVRAAAPPRNSAAAVVPRDSLFSAVSRGLAACMALSMSCAAPPPTQPLGLRCVHDGEHARCFFGCPSHGDMLPVPATGTAEKVSLALRARMQSAHRFRCWCFGVTCASHPGAHRLRCF